MGDLEPDALAAAIVASYGEDHTFSVPILTHCALAGRLGEGREAWRHVPALPFELAALPRRWFPRVGLPVVSYALPALIAVGRVRHHHRPSRNPVARWARDATRARTLRVLEEIQPASGGFLEAVPLTAFVTMSLAASGLAGCAPARAAIRFLERSVRPDGSWPIDTNLATWVTSLSVDALAEAGEPPLEEPQRTAVLRFLLDQQYREVHPYTGAAPGAWAWTDLPGGVPDADDTPGALVALSRLGARGDETLRAARAGVRWLLDLQNRDGGVPTFCRGWGKLPFDRSGADLTAHALRAFAAWRASLPDLGRRIDRAVARAGRYLVGAQRPDGAWIPLWFGNEHEPACENPVYGTSRVLAGIDALERPSPDLLAAAARARAWLVAAQNDDGGWGGARGTPSSIEETALALHALLSPRGPGALGGGSTDEADHAVTRGLEWLLGRIAAGGLAEPTPIGFYFASLWYYERLYPLIYATAALGRACR